MWSWIGIGAAGWCMFSFAFAVLVGRAIRLADQAAQQPTIPERPKYHSGLQITRDGEELSGTLSQAEASCQDAASASHSLDSY